MHQLEQLPPSIWGDVAAADLMWQDDALCAQTDPEIFHPHKGGSTREAKRTCLACTVRGECLEYALTNDEDYGIWGGLTRQERRKLRRQARAAEADVA